METENVKLFKRITWGAAIAVIAFCLLGIHLISIGHTGLAIIVVLLAIIGMLICIVADATREYLEKYP